MTNRFFAGQTDYIEQLNALDVVETGDHIADTTGAHAATAISNTPAGNIAATTVQAAINELDTEKLSASAATLPSSFVNASLNSITPTGGALSVTGSFIRHTGGGGDGYFGAGTALVSGAATGTMAVRSDYGDLLFSRTGTEIARVSSSGLSVTGSISTTGGVYVGDGTQKQVVIARGPGSGVNNGAAFIVQNGGGSVIALGNKSALLGGAYDATPLLYGNAAIEVNQALNVTGSISATSLVDISAAGAGRIKFPATQNASADANTLDDYQEATYTGTATGMTASPTGTVSYTLTGNEATLNLPEITGTSNATTFTVTGMPAEARPATRKTVLGRARDNGGAVVPVRIDIETTGVLTIYANADAGAFTSSGTKTLAECSVTYTRV